MAVKSRFYLTPLKASLTLAILILGFALPIPAVKAQTLSKALHEQPSGLAQTPLEVISLRRAIIGQESGANFRAVNPHSGALGYGQVMPDNVPSWSKEALGYSVTNWQFLNNPQIQLYIIDFKLNQYWQKALVASGGNPAIAVQRVAAQWYSGRQELYTSTRPQYYRGYRYPSIAEYSYAVLRRFAALHRVALLSQPLVLAPPAEVANLPSPPATPAPNINQSSQAGGQSVAANLINAEFTDRAMLLASEYGRNAADFNF